MHHTVHDGSADAGPPQPITVRGPGEILELIPYLLGFHPDESLVLIGLAGNRLLVTARIDLHDIGQRPRLLHDTLEAMVRGGTEQIIGAAYTNDPIDQAYPLPHASVAAQLVEEADEAGVELVDCLLVTAARWWSYRCADPGCCPDQGTPLPDEPSAVVAQATYAGLTALPNRAALTGMFTPLPDRANLAEALAAEQDVELNAALDGTHGRR